jgi:N-acetyl-gamma-glutamylphosphate reductase
MDISYCYEQCSIGKEAAEKFLHFNNSAFDAATDFRFFTDNCFKTCPYKDKHTQQGDLDK